MSRIPVTVLTGFLGAGKTTLLNHLVRQPALQDCAVLINEFGEVGIDHLLVQALDGETVLLESGCLCCTLRDGLARSLRELFMRALRKEIRLRSVVIETTGLADPGPVIRTLRQDFFLAQRFRIESVVTVVDAVHAEEQISRYAEAVKQVALADTLVLSKTDLASPAQLMRIERQVAHINPGARRLCAVRGQLAAEDLLGGGFYMSEADMRDFQRWIALEPGQADMPEAAHVRDGGRGNSVHAFALRYETPVAWGDFSTALDMLQQSTAGALLRYKGIVNVAGEHLPRIVQGVRHQRYDEIVLPQWPDSDRATRLVFIVDGLPRAVVDRAFAGFCGLRGETATRSAA